MWTLVVGWKLNTRKPKTSRSLIFTDSEALNFLSVSIKTLFPLQAVSNLLENPVEPVNDYSFFDCLDSVSENSKALRDGMTDVSGNAKTGDMSAFDDAVKSVADAVIKLTEAASQV